MTEIEQLLSEALTALAQTKTMTPWEKMHVCERLADMANAANEKFYAEDERLTQAKWEADCKRLGMSAF